jgi:hypothetical protein
VATQENSASRRLRRAGILGEFENNNGLCWQRTEDS